MTRRLQDEDWTFGNGKADYLTQDNEILQNVKTRIRSFKGDWFLDQEAGIDWFNLLSDKETSEQILKELDRVVLSTDGVVRIVEMTIDVQGRDATIFINLDTIYKNNSLGVTL